MPTHDAGATPSRDSAISATPSTGSTMRAAMTLPPEIENPTLEDVTSKIAEDQPRSRWPKRRATKRAINRQAGMTTLTIPAKKGFRFPMPPSRARRRTAYRWRKRREGRI